MTDRSAETATEWHERLVATHSAHNYHPLPVVVAHAEGAWVTDVEGRRYLDCLAGYSALNFGHRHPALVAAAHRQLDRVTLTSRAFGNDQLGPFCAELAQLLGKQLVLPMNTGAEAVESGIKVARKWGYEVKGVAPDRARIVVAAGGFHGRTTTDRRLLHRPGGPRRLRPVHAGFRRGALRRRGRAAGGDHPGHRGRADRADPGRGRGDRAAGRIPGRGPGLLRRGRRAVRGRRGAVRPRSHRTPAGHPGRRASTPTSTCSARPWAAGSCRCPRWSPTRTCSACCVPASTAARSAATRWPARSAEPCSICWPTPVRTGCSPRLADVGDRLHARLAGLVGYGVVAVRGRGLWAGVDIDPRGGTGRAISEALARRGVLVKDTHGSTIRLSPPLVVTEGELDHAVDTLGRVLTES